VASTHHVATVNLHNMHTRNRGAFSPSVGHDVAHTHLVATQVCTHVTAVLSHRAWGKT